MGTGDAAMTPTDVLRAARGTNGFQIGVVMISVAGVICVVADAWGGGITSLAAMPVHWE